MFFKESMSGRRASQTRAANSAHRVLVRLAIMGDAGELQSSSTSSEHASELACFRNAVESSGSSIKGVDDATCMRFLQANDMHIEKAARMYSQYRTWRTSFVPLGHIPEEQVISELNTERVALQGHSKQGLPLVISLAHKHYPSKTDIDTVKRFHVHTIDKALASAPSGVEKIIMVMDLNHFGYKNVDIKGSIAALQILQNYYPGRLGTLYMVNAPKFFRGVWKMIAPCLEKSTKEKIVFLDDRNMTKVLLSEVDAAVLPSMYGGKADFILIQDVHVPNWPKPAISLT